MSQKVLIIDAMNMFIRNYVINPSLSSDGSPIGGTKGFLQTLQKLTREINPDRIICVWDGGGGSKKRQALAKQYKEGRKPLKLNRAYDGMSALDETQNRYSQMKKTIDYLNKMPIVQFMIEDVEADDVIAYLCKSPILSERVKIIVSMDKDFYQLCDDETIVYRPIRDEFLNKKRIIEQYNIHPNNFAIARAVDGDKSDNLEGVRGAGLKTISKRLPFLLEDKNYTLQDLFKFCREKTSEENVKLYFNILQDKKKVELNYKIMQLYAPQISPRSTKKINNEIKNFTPKFNRTDVLKYMIQDGIDQQNWNSLFQKFRAIIHTSGN
jgi:DNA polymerase-1